MTAALPRPALDDRTAEEFSASPEHNGVPFLPAVRLMPCQPEPRPVVREAGLVLTEDGRHLRRPDLVVRHRERMWQVPHPEDVAFVAEIVPPGPVTTGRVTQPVGYAGAGIRSYRRVEQKPESSRW